MTLSFVISESIFKLALEDSGVLTECEINSIYTDEFDEVERGIFNTFR